MTKIFADGAAKEGILQAANNPAIMGFTTNPSLMRAAGVKNYMEFCHDIIPLLREKRPDTCISLEVFADDYHGMVKQAKTLYTLSEQYDYKVYVKIPITFTNGEYTSRVITSLTNSMIPVNVTAIFTRQQAQEAMAAIHSDTSSIISIFAGRIADAGINAVNIMGEIINLKDTVFPVHETEILWASTRQIYNYVEAMHCGCDIITMTPDLISKLKTIGKNLNDYSLETVNMFYNDAKNSGFEI